MLGVLLLLVIYLGLQFSSVCSAAVVFKMNFKTTNPPYTIYMLDKDSGLLFRGVCSKLPLADALLSDCVLNFRGIDFSAEINQAYNQVFVGMLKGNDVNELNEEAYNTYTHEITSLENLFVVNRNSDIPNGALLKNETSDASQNPSNKNATRPFDWLSSLSVGQYVSDEPVLIGGGSLDSIDNWYSGLDIKVVDLQTGRIVLNARAFAAFNTEGIGIDLGEINDHYYSGNFNGRNANVIFYYLTGYSTVFICENTLEQEQVCHSDMPGGARSLLRIYQNSGSVSIEIEWHSLTDEYRPTSTPRHINDPSVFKLTTDNILTVFYRKGSMPNLRVLSSSKPPSATASTQQENEPKPTEGGVQFPRAHSTPGKK